MINKVTLLGRLSSDVTLKHSASGTAVANFSLATNEKWTDKNGQKKERAEFHRIVIWNKVAELCDQYLNKGSQVYIEGKITYRSYEVDGVTKYITEIIANSVQFLDSKKSSDSWTEDRLAPKTPKPSEQAEFTSDEIPF